jgi:hypothetical protein
MDVIGIWKRNIDRRFEGVEECPICYLVVHATYKSLPKLVRHRLGRKEEADCDCAQACATCKKKFHSACLYKWFNTSHQNTCPMCRSPF